MLLQAVNVKCITSQQHITHTHRIDYQPKFADKYNQEDSPVPGFVDCLVEICPARHSPSSHHHLFISMSVVLTRQVRLKVGAGAAKPGPAIGQALGPLGLNMAEFCKQFNEATKNYEKDIPVPVVLSGQFRSYQIDSFSYLLFILFSIF